jgi:hypothetical protein
MKRKSVYLLVVSAWCETTSWSCVVVIVLYLSCCFRPLRSVSYHLISFANFFPNHTLTGRSVTGHDYVVHVMNEKRLDVPRIFFVTTRYVRWFYIFFGFSMSWLPNIFIFYFTSFFLHWFHYQQFLCFRKYIIHTFGYIYKKKKINKKHFSKNKVKPIIVF